MMRPSLNEQLTDFAITKQVADEFRQTREEFRTLEREIASLRALAIRALIMAEEIEGCGFIITSDAVGDLFLDLVNYLKIETGDEARAALQSKEVA